MQQLFRFIYQNRSFLSFLVLLSLGFFLVVRFNQYPAAVYFHTANRMSGQMLSMRQGVGDYFELRPTNEQLAEENARLRREVLNPYIESVGRLGLPTPQTDALPGQYDIISAKVINNSTARFRNYITLNKGSRHGIESGMGVMGPNGVVGQVDFVSRNYATVISLLHTDLQVSSLLTSTGNFCATNWRGIDPLRANLLYLPLHTQPEVGDTIVTSGFNSVFPEGLAIGQVDNFGQTTDANFYDVTVKLATDFTALRYVYVIRNTFRPEQDSLQIVTDPTL